MSVSTFKRTSIVLGKDGAGQDFKAFGDTSGAYIRWDHENNKLILAGGADMDFGTFGTPLIINQANNYPLGIFGEVSVANALGTNVERGLWVRTKVSANQTGAFSIFGGQLQFRWADGCALLGSGVENAQYAGAWLYLEQDTTGQALADYAHASGVVVQVETFGALTIPTNAHLSGVKIESRLGAANGAVISLNSGTIAGLFITKSPAASGVTAQDWPKGIYIENCVTGIEIPGSASLTTMMYLAGSCTRGVWIRGGSTVCLYVDPDADTNVDYPFQINVSDAITIADAAAMAYLVAWANVPRALKIVQAAGTMARGIAFEDNNGAAKIETLIESDCAQADFLIRMASDEGYMDTNTGAAEARSGRLKIKIGSGTRYLYYYN